MGGDGSNLVLIPCQHFILTTSRSNGNSARRIGGDFAAQVGKVGDRVSAYKLHLQQ